MIRTLPEMLKRAVENFPENGIGYVQSSGEILFTSYLELHNKALMYLSGLKKLKLKPGHKVILVLEKNDDTVPMLWGCFYGGIIPTILQPPVSFTSFNPAAEKLEKVYHILEEPLIIFSTTLHDYYSDSNYSGKNYISLSDIELSDDEQDIFSPDENEIAFIQFSSGSTGDPKGVILSHKNIISNLAAISNGLDFQLSDKTVNWMPLYHDMGLIGYHLAPIFGQYNQYLIDPVDFVKKPTIWLDVMEKVKCTITGCPNFGQALLLRHLKHKTNTRWDLSSVKAITNGAEPISVKVMTEFIEKLKPFNLKPGSMMPVYGMAESTLAISFSKLHEGPTITRFSRDSIQNNIKAEIAEDTSASYQEIVSVGKALNDIDIRITDENDNELPEAYIGHIQIKGPSITSGYYNNSEETKRAFCGEWLRTGDKGFFYMGNIYVNGRYKDIIFINGKNYYSNDLENIALKVEGIQFGKIVVGGVFNEQSGQDKLIIFLTGSLNNKFVSLMKEIQKLFRSTLGISPQVFIPVKSNQIPRTSSGKIQRYKLISQYLKGEFDEVIEEVKKIL